MTEHLENSMVIKRMAVHLWVGLVLCAVPLAGSAGERPTGELRHAALLEESLDGEKQPSSAAEAALVEALLAQGVVFVDESQARKIRSVTDVGSLMEGGISEVITSLDADIIIAGECRVNSIGSRKVGTTTLTRCDADLEVRVIAVDTGEILAAHTVRAEALGLNARQAARDSARKAAVEAAGKIVESVARKATSPSRIEISVTGTANVAVTERIRSALEGVPGVASVKVLQAGRAMTKMVAEVAGTDARTLALELQALPDVGLEVWGYTERAIKAEFSPAAALDMPLVTLPFEDKTGDKAYAWMAPTLADVFSIELANCEFLDPVEGTASAPSKLTASSLRSYAKKLDLDPGKTLVATGSYSAEQGAIRFEVRIIAANSGKVVLSAQDSCRPEGLSDCAIKAAAGLGDRLLPEILKKRKLFGRSLSKKQVKLAAGATAAPGKPLQVVEAVLSNIFPSRVARYDDHPVGTLKVANRGEEAIEDLVVSARLLGFMPAPLDHRHGALAPGASAEIPVKLVLDKGALTGLDENRPAMMTVKYSYRVGDFHLEQVSSHSVMVYDRNSITWTEPGSAAGFVTPGAEPLGLFVRSATQAGLDENVAAHPLFQAVKLHYMLGKHGVKYQADAANPYGKQVLDYVQYALETLSTRTGDCDDLAVLYSSLLESVGVRTALVLTPGHVFCAVDTGVPAQLAQRISPDPDRVMLRGGTAWIPVETTMVGAEFEEAWGKAAAELHSWKGQEGKVTVVEVREAWKEYPPANLAAGVPGAFEPVAVADEIKLRLTRLEEQRVAAVAALVKELEEGIAKEGLTPQLANRLGVLKAKEGRLEEARALFEEAANRHASPEAWNNLGNIKVAAGKLDSGLECYGEALKTAPDNVEVLLNAGILSFMKEQYDEALDFFVQCIELGAEDRVAMLANLGVGPGGAKGASADKQAGRGLAELAREAFKRTNKAAPESMGANEGRRAGKADSETPLCQFLFWL